MNNASLFTVFSHDLWSLSCHVLLCGGEPTLPQVACNRLMLYNNVSILKVLLWEFQQEFQI